MNGTVELAQQRLLELEPARVVPAVAGAQWWGIDPSTLRIALAVDDGEGGPVITRSFARAESAKRLAWIFDDTRDLARGLAEFYPPGYVLVEQPGAKIMNPELFYAVGAILGGVWAGVHDQLGDAPFLVETMPPMSWKKLACGRGNLFKPKRERGGPPPGFEEYPVAAWARENGYTGDSWDECDALGLAVAARRSVRFEPVG